MVYLAPSCYYLQEFIWKWLNSALCRCYATFTVAWKQINRAHQKPRELCVCRFIYMRLRSPASGGSGVSIDFSMVAMATPWGCCCLWVYMYYSIQSLLTVIACCPAGRNWGSASTSGCCAWQEHDSWNFCAPVIAPSEVLWDSVLLSRMKAADCWEHFLKSLNFTHTEEEICTQDYKCLKETCIMHWEMQDLLNTQLISCIFWSEKAKNV